jgi:chromosome segregation ATPase
VGSEATTELLSHARELERRDAVVADELSALAELSESVGRLRARVGALRESLASLPLERERLVERRTAAEHELTAATAGVEAAEARVAELSRSRRRREDELERAEKEASTAREALTDSKARLARVEESSDALQSDEAATEVGRLAVAIGANARVASSTTRDPGRGLEALEEWASQARSALFVARGTLEQERERIVVEANALGSAVLGEQLGGSSAAVIRRRVEAVLGGEGQVSD